jgi:hypothetical protein
MKFENMGCCPDQEDFGFVEMVLKGFSWKIIRDAKLR